MWLAHLNARMSFLQAALQPVQPLQVRKGLLPMFLQGGGGRLSGVQQVVEAFTLACCIRMW